MKINVWCYPEYRALDRMLDRKENVLTLNDSSLFSLKQNFLNNKLNKIKDLNVEKQQIFDVPLNSN